MPVVTLVQYRGEPKAQLGVKHFYQGRSRGGNQPIPSQNQNFGESRVGGVGCEQKDKKVHSKI